MTMDTPNHTATVTDTDAGRAAFRHLNALVVQRLTAAAAAKSIPPTWAHIDHDLAVHALSFMSLCLAKLADQWASQAVATSGTGQLDDTSSAAAMVGAVSLFCTSVASFAKVLAAQLVQPSFPDPDPDPVPGLHDHDDNVEMVHLVELMVDAISEPMVRLTTTCLSTTLHSADLPTASTILSRTLPALDALLTLLITLDKRTPRDSPSPPDPLATALAHLLVQLPPLTLASPLQSAPAFWSALWPTTTSWLCTRFARDPLFLRDLLTTCLLPTLRPATSDLDPRLAYPPAFWRSVSLLIPHAFPNPLSSPGSPPALGHPHLPDAHTELAHRANVYLDLLDHLSHVASHPRSAALVPAATLMGMVRALTHLLRQDSLVVMLVVNDAYGIATVRALTLGVTRRHAVGGIEGGRRRQIGGGGGGGREEAGDEDEDEDGAGEFAAFVHAVEPLMATSIPGLATVPSVMELAGLTAVDSELPSGGGSGKLVLGKWAWLVAQLVLADQAATEMLEWMMNGAPAPEDDGPGEIPDGLVIVDEVLGVVDLLAPDVFACPCCQPPQLQGIASWVWEQSISALVAPIVTLGPSGSAVERLVERWIRSMVRQLIKCRHTSTAQIVLACMAVMMECVEGQPRPAAVSEWIASVAVAVKDHQLYTSVVRQRLEALTAVVGTWGACGLGVL